MENSIFGGGNPRGPFKPIQESKKKNKFEKPFVLSQEQKSSYIQLIDKELDSLRNNLDTTAHETQTLDSGIYKKRLNSIEEIANILKGIIDPHKKISYLNSKELFISYSRRNEEWARKIHLALRRMGLIVWFDNQETNVTIDSKISREFREENFIINELNNNLSSEKSTLKKEEGARGIGMGIDYRESIVNGIPENGYTTVLLTHDVLDKFDIVGGMEIPESIKKNSELLVIAVDDPIRGSVLERLNKFVVEKPGNEIYNQSVKKIQEAKIIRMEPEELNTLSTEELGNKILDQMIGHTEEDEESRVQPRIFNMAEVSQTRELPSSLVETINLLYTHTPAQNKEESDLYQRALEESKLIYLTHTNPKEMVDTYLTGTKKIGLGNFYEDIEGKEQEKYKNILKNFKEFGLKNTDFTDWSEKSYILTEFTAEDLDLDPGDFIDKFEQIVYDRPINLIGLIKPGFYTKLSEQLKKDKLVLSKAEGSFEFYSKYSQLIQKVQGLEKIKNMQGLQISSDIDFNDSQSFASYIIMREALVRYAATSVS